MTYAGNIPKFYLYKALRFPLLWLPVYVVIFQQDRGFTLAQIGIIDAVFWLASALGEVPTGAVADRYGRKTSMLIGVALYTVSVGMVAAVDSYALTLLAHVGWGLALTLTSGADEALLYESLKADGRSLEYTRVYARVEVIQTGARAIGSVVGGLLAAVMLVLPFSMSAVLGVLTFLVVLTLKEPQRDGDAIGDAQAPGQRPRYADIMRDSLRLIRTRPLMRWAVVYLAVVPLAPFIIYFTYIQVYALEVGVDVAWLGGLVMLISGVSILGAWLAPKLAGRYGEMPVLLAIPPLLLAGLLGLAMITPVWPGLVLIGGLVLVMAAIRPLVMTIIQREATDSVRATVVSLASLTWTLMLAVFSPLYGWLADRSGVNAVFWGMALVVGAAALVLLAMRRRPRALAGEQV